MTGWSLQGEVRGESLALGQWRVSDAAWLFDGFDDALTRTQTEQPDGKRIESAYDAWLLVQDWTGRARRSAAVGLVARRLEDHEAVVCVMLERLEADAVELSFWTAPACRGCGHARDGVAMATRWALEDLGIARLWAEVSPSNSASARALARAGFTPLSDEILPAGLPSHPTSLLMCATRKSLPHP